MGGLSRYKQVILVAVQSFVQLPLEFGRLSRERGWDGKSDGEYHRYEDETGEGTGAGTEREMKKKPVDYSVIMMYNVTRRERKVVVTRGVTVNEGWVRQVMWMCGFEDEDAEPGIVEGDGNDKGTKVKGRKPVGEEMKTTVWNGTTEHLDAGDWQEVAAGVSRYELIKEALEELRGDVEGWLS